MRKLKLFTSFLLIALLLGLWWLSRALPRAQTLSYGVSFSRFHSDELKLDWKETYLAVLNDLGVRRFRFTAHWPLTEPKEGLYDFRELDFQMDRAREKNASVILAVGRRLPGWPECHVPEWAKALNPADRREKLLRYIKTVVDRYKGYKNLEYWQVENEPYLTFFSRQACGALDEDFLKQEIAYVRSLDPAHPILLTDSGELSTWYGAYTHGDVFGTSMYLYIWNRSLGPLRYPIGPWFFRLKKSLVELVAGHKPSIVIELSGEPWLLQPIIDTPIDIQLQRMGPDKLNEMVEFSSKTNFESFYLWGAEWWYWLKKNGHPELWDRAKELFKK